MQRHVHNNFLQWLGFNVKKSNDKKAIKDYIDFVERRFKLVMFTEYFDESLVLLRRTMNWSMTDIFYSYANEATKKSGTVLSPDDINKLLNIKHNLGDWMLYQHFNKSFWEKVSTQPEFFDEVKVFKQLNTKVREFCFSQELEKDKSLKLELITKWELDPLYFGEKDCLAIRIKDGKALEFSHALDKYCPFRSSKLKYELKY
ncbi:GAL3ST1 [Bugula neritina]|uniref:GAL3ST1 n=1 Tax=Bugula neritina TaxID=10212 RepID=A0A7J7KEQ5_BUGNE|nr:GAL3ST1 [Bugula neritina]